MTDQFVTDTDRVVLNAVRDATDILASDCAARLAGEPNFDIDAYFADLRAMVEARATTLKAVAEQGPMGGGGPDEA